MSATSLFAFHTKRPHPLRAASKKNKKGLASVILATNSPNSELVLTILIEKIYFVNKNIKKKHIFFNIIFVVKTTIYNNCNLI